MAIKEHGSKARRLFSFIKTANSAAAIKEGKVFMSSNTATRASNHAGAKSIRRAVRSRILQRLRGK